MRKITYVIGLLVAFGLLAQDKTAMKYAKTITADDLKAHLSILASDEYEGRETGKKGQKMAAKYIAKHFESLGFEAPVDGSYFQKFDLTEAQIGSVYFRKGDDKLVGFEDFVYYSSSETSGEEYIKAVIAKEDDEEDYTGKYVVFTAEKLGGLQEKAEKAKEAGAAGVIIIVEDDQEFDSFITRYSPYLQRPSLRMEGRDNESTKLIIGNKAMAAWMFDKEFETISSGDESQIIFNADYLDKPVGTENVLGFLKGTEKPDEVLIITSHYDHVGIINGEIHNGADDDGSGTVTVLEIAEAFSNAAAKNKGPKRSVLFMTVTGEEKGLLGSKYYTDTDPIFPLENTVANLNIDMVGRVDEAHEENPDYIYLIGSDKLSQELHVLSENMNKTYTNLELDYTYNDENDPNRFYYRSDHYNFAKNNVPIIFYFNGTHEDYHKPTDTVDKIDFETMEKRARLVFHTGWEIANREERIKVDKIKEEKVSGD
ncbi:M28 family peptidase [Ekhidna sp. To15]|uniref:M28 family peptidase n=1 Tax=Ekhidna sp. To15 TaxID=3395267 RepID=UPI003F51D7E7